MSHDWNYHEDDPTHGPHHWAHQYPDVGQAQSPIDIQIDYSDLQRHQDQVCCSCDRLPLHKGLQGLTIGHSNSGQPGGWSKESDGDPKRNEGGGSTGGQCNSEDDGCLANARLAEGRNGLSAAEGEHLAREQSKCERLNEKKDSIRESEGERQRTRYCATNKKLFLGYPRYLDSIRLSNTGHAWQVDMPQELGQHTLLCGPPLGEREYRLAQFHCHWGSDCSAGSEHLVNGRAYSAEIHFVHWNCSDFSSLEEAARHKHGLAVLAVFVEALEDDEQHCNKHLERIVSALELISDKVHSSVLVQRARVDVKKLFPSNRWLYATYEGSLTTPPLSEVVDWVVFLQPIQCSRRQIEAFRQMKCSPTGERLQRNCRPLQPLNERVVSIWTHTGPSSGAGHHHHHKHHHHHPHAHHKEQCARRA